MARVPGPNLIRMLKNIAGEIKGKQKNRAKPPQPRLVGNGDREALSTTLKEVGQFNRLLLALRSDAEPSKMSNAASTFTHCIWPRTYSRS